MRKHKNYLYVCIFVFACILPFFLHENSTLFGSTTDYANQHIQIAKAIRQAVYDQGLFPTFMEQLGAGQNIYNFSYYGLFRLDILLSLLLPSVDMYIIISSYMVISYAISLCLFYKLLCEHHCRWNIALCTTIMFALSSYLFQLHRQILFVNYMPFLLLSLLVIKKSKPLWLLVPLFVMIILHSFFFSISCALVLGLYYLYCNQNQLQPRKLFMFACMIALAYLLSGFYLLPTGLAILANSRFDGTQEGLALYNFSFNNLLYDKYGMGLSYLSLICLYLGLKDRNLRKLVGIIFMILMVPAISLVLNCGLYVRPKVLIPFLPLILLLVGQVLTKVAQREIQIHIYDVLPLAIPLVINHSPTIMVLDALCSFSVICLMYYRKKAVYVQLSLFTMVSVMLTNNHSETYEKKSTYQKLTTLEQDPLLSTLDTKNYRLEDIRFASTSVNTALTDIKRTTMYTSINNTTYNKFFYDTMLQAIPSRNRVITSYQEHPIFANLMGIRYLYTTSDHIPFGYDVYAKANGGTVLENKQVRPIAYGTSQLLSEKTFQKLTPEKQINALQNYVITKESNHTKTQLVAKEMDLQYTLTKQSNNLHVTKTKTGFSIQAKKKSNMTLQLETPCRDLLMLSFDVKNISNINKQDLTIEINGVRNKLSSLRAAYPNKNHRFTYMLSDAKEISELQLSLSKGTYDITNLKIYQLPASTPFNLTPLNLTTSSNVLEGTINMEDDGMFVTSIPMQAGFSLRVDGKKQTIETVNTTFVGCKLSKGNHHIELQFEPPGQQLGSLMSCFGILIFICVYIFERKHQYEH
ncbi:hypothetical protein A4S06_09370 [Erysipelotrichaceae bacterium MTC7]|nr:hypothetical protein A4S06_09370 [Erysipelotrichaceae bacterium MTC7]